MKIDYVAPVINVEFTSVDGDKFQVENQEFGGDIISLTTTKSMGEAAGSFTIEMVARDSYIDFFKIVTSSKKANAYDLFKASCLVDIYINGKENMLGVVDSITRTVNMRGKNPIRRITITGRDLGAYLLDHKLWFDIKAGERTFNFPKSKAMEALGIVGGESPAQLIMQIVNNWFIRVINQVLSTYDDVFKFSDGTGMEDKLIAMPEVKSEYNIKQDGDVIDKTGETIITAGTLLSSVQGPGTLSETTYGNFYPMSFSLWQYSGDIMNLLKTITSFPFNELYIDTGGTDVVLGSPKSRTINQPYWQTATSYYDASWNKGEGKNVELSKSTNPEWGKRTFTMQEKKAYLIFRPTPYDDNDVKGGIQPTDLGMNSLLSMQDLKTHIIDDSVIVEKTLTLSKNDIPSFYRVRPANGLLTGDAAKAFSPAEYDERALRRYGYSPMDVKLDSFDINTKNFKRGGVEDITKKIQKKLKSWYQNSDKYLTGTMMIKGNENIRIGHRASYEKLEGEIENEYEEGKYYIKAVSQNYVYGQKYETGLSLDRGTCPKLMEK